MADSKADKIWAAAVKRAVHRRAENVEGKPQKIERLADQLVDFALEGQGWAMQEIGNRLDGRPAQSVSVGGEGEGGAIPVMIGLVGVSGEKG